MREEILRELLTLQPSLAPDRRWEYPWVIERMKTPAKVLDVGCGGSIIQKYLIRHGYDVIAVDIDSNAKYYYDRTPREKFVQVDARYPPQDWHGKFDYILLISLVEHLPNDDDIVMVKNLGRCLMQGGRMFISFPYGRDGWFNVGLGNVVQVERHYTKDAIQKRLLASSNLKLLELRVFTREEIGWKAKDVAMIMCCVG